MLEIFDGPANLVAGGHAAVGSRCGGLTGRPPLAGRLQFAASSDMVLPFFKLEDGGGLTSWSVYTILLSVAEICCTVTDGHPSGSWQRRQWLACLVIALHPVPLCCKLQHLDGWSADD